MIFGTPAITFAYHLGVHCTDEDQLLRSLLKNADDLCEQKIILPRPRRYRDLLGDVTNRFRGDPMPEDEQQDLFHKLVLGHEAERV